MTKCKSLGDLNNKTALIVLEAGCPRSKFLRVVSSEPILLTCMWLPYLSGVPWTFPLYTYLLAHSDTSSWYQDPCLNFMAMFKYKIVTFWGTWSWKLTIWNLGGRAGHKILLILDIQLEMEIYYRVLCTSLIKFASEPRFKNNLKMDRDKLAFQAVTLM